MRLEFFLILLVCTIPASFASSTTAEMIIIKNEDSNNDANTGTSSGTSSSNGGSGNTGISPPSGTGFAGKIKRSFVIPDWVKEPVLWWASDQITTQEFSSIMSWIIDEDILKINNKIKPDTQLTNMAPSTKHIFSLWERGILSEDIILQLVQKYREYGVW